MKINYTLRLFKPFIHKVSQAAVLVALLGTSSTRVLSQQSYTFTNASSTGSLGPSQTQINSAYSLTNLNGSVVATAGIQSFTVPSSGLYLIDVSGASGGTLSSYSTLPGLGSRMQGQFNLTAGNVLKILVGQKGGDGCGGGGGGGGTYVTNNGVLLIAAGGGGGPTSDNNAANSVTVTSGTNDNPGGNIAGGTGGGGGQACNVGSPGANHGGGGGGYSGNGATSTAPTPGGGGLSFTNGGTGGAGYAPGGFGGGGGATNCTVGGGGGGGYSGGAGGQQVNYCLSGINRSGGGGGGSYNTGANQVNTAGIISGNGKAILTSLCNFTLASASVNGPGPICSGNSVTLTTNAISNYSWSNGSTTSSIVVSPTITATYTLTAMSPLNCTTSVAITVTVDNTPTVTVVSTASAVCAGKTVTITASGATTYTWTGAVTGSAATFTPGSPSSTYTVTGTNACGTATASASVTVNALPPVTASINNPTVCTGGSVTLNGGGSVTYTWSNGYSNNVAFAPTASANYTVTGTAANGCTASAVTSVTVFITPNIAPVASPTAICVGATATLSATGATGYTWTPGTALTTSNIVVSPPSTTTYTLFRINGACPSTSTITLVVNPNPVMSAGATPGTICAGASVSLTAFGAITYSWVPGGFTAANLVLYPNFSTNYVVTGSNGNCTTTMTVPVVVNPSPTISVVSTPTICSGGTAQLSASGNAATYTWSAGPPNTSVITVTPSATTIYTITATNTFSCMASQNALIVVYQTPSSTLSTSSPYICSAQSATIGAVNASGISYLWNTGATTASIVVNPGVTTSYTLTATDLSSNCQGTNSITLAVYISTFSVAGPTAVCKGSTATFTASGAATSYSWSSNAGGVTTNTAALSPTVSQMYSVAGITGSCTSTQNVSLTVNPIPNVTATKAKSTVCVYEPNTTITAAGATSYSWSTGDLTATAIISPTISTTYTVTGTDLNGCSKTVTVTQFVAACLGIENYAAQGIEISIYPNPNNGNFTISTDVAMSVNLVNTLGEVVKTVELSNANNNEISVSNLANGIYFITGQSNGLKVNKKIVVQR